MVENGDEGDLWREVGCFASVWWAGIALLVLGFIVWSLPSNPNLPSDLLMHPGEHAMWFSFKTCVCWGLLKFSFNPDFNLIPFNFIQWDAPASMCALTHPYELAINMIWNFSISLCTVGLNQERFSVLEPLELKPLKYRFRIICCGDFWSSLPIPRTMHSYTVWYWLDVLMG